MAVNDSNNPMNLYTSKILEYPDLLKDFLFQVNFEFNANTALYNLVQSIEKSLNIESNSFVGETLMLRARRISLPHKSIETINTHYMGSKRNYPGRTTTDGTVQIAFDEFQDLGTQDIFYEWMNLIYNHGIPLGTREATNINTDIETGGAVSDFIRQYTAQIKLFVYDSRLQSQLPFYWIFYDVFPTDNGQVQLNAESSGKVSPEITFNYNTWKMYGQSATLK